MMVLLRSETLAGGRYLAAEHASAGVASFNEVHIDIAISEFVDYLPQLR